MTVPGLGHVVLSEWWIRDTAFQPSGSLEPSREMVNKTHFLGLFFFFFYEMICPFLTSSNSHLLLYHQQLEALQIDLSTKDSFSVEIPRNGVVALKDLPLISTSIQVGESANFSNHSIGILPFKKVC